MRHGSIRWYGRRLNSEQLERFGMFGLGLAHPVNGRSITFTEDGFDADVEPDGLRAQVDAAEDTITFGLWLAHSSNTLVTVSGSAEAGLNAFGLDGLDFEEQERVCAAVLWVAAHDAGTKLVVADDYLDDYVDGGPDPWDEYVAGTTLRPSLSPKLLLDRDESGCLRLEVPPFD